MPRNAIRLVFLVLGFAAGMFTGLSWAQAQKGDGDRFAQGAERLECCVKLGYIVAGIEQAMTSVGPPQESESTSRTLARGIISAAFSNAGFTCEWGEVADSDGTVTAVWRCHE